VRFTLTAVDMQSGRHDYETMGIDAADLPADPLDQFRAWYDDAVAAGLPEPNAMLLATSSPDGAPSCRYVLLRGLDADGFAFFTHTASRKGRELTANPRAALTFGWLELHRQVRVHGHATALNPAASDAYFASRARASQIGAWASPQSDALADREELERRVAEAELRFAGGAVTRPPHWGGWVVSPADIEFWQGRRNRLHDRLRYRRAAGRWVIERLAP
jgi:pyridoxamine 5'-phosphate oxidase